MPKITPFKDQVVSENLFPPTEALLKYQLKSYEHPLLLFVLTILSRVKQKNLTHLQNPF